MTVEAKTANLVVVNAGLSATSTTKMLGERSADAAASALREAGYQVRVDVVDLGEMATDVIQSLVSASPTDAVQKAIEKIAVADGLVFSTPVYKAGLSGLFKSFIDVLDNDLIVAKPVILAATAGTARHSMVVDSDMRSLFAFLRALPVPTSLFAAPEDWADSSLSKRMKRAGTELALLVDAGVSERITGASWGAYNHEFGGNATKSQESEVSFDTDLMRLAAGGTGTN